MLKIIGRAEAPRAQLELDPHLPFLLRLGDAPARGESLIWYCKPDDRSIFEVWLDGRTGALHRISLVAVAPSRAKETDVVDSGPRVPTAGRVPIGDISAWRDAEVVRSLNQLTEHDPFSVVMGQDFVSIRFGESGEPAEWIVNHRSRFGVDKSGRLLRIELLGLTQRDMTSIRGAI